MGSYRSQFIGFREAQDLREQGFREADDFTDRNAVDAAAKAALRIRDTPEMADLRKQIEPLQARLDELAAIEREHYWRAYMFVRKWGSVSKRAKPRVQPVLEPENDPANYPPIQERPSVALHIPLPVPLPE